MTPILDIVKLANAIVVWEMKSFVRNRSASLLLWMLTSGLWASQLLTMGSLLAVGLNVSLTLPSTTLKSPNVSLLYHTRTHIKSQLKKKIPQRCLTCKSLPRFLFNFRFWNIDQLHPSIGDIDHWVKQFLDQNEEKWRVCMLLLFVMVQWFNY